MAGRHHPGRSQRYAQMLNHCCVTLGTTFTLSGSWRPLEVKSAITGKEVTLLELPLSWVLLVSVGVTFLSGGARSGGSSKVQASVIGQ